MGYLKYVNTKMGADSKMEFSRGNTLPLCQLPFGMCAFCPETQIPRNTPTWFYDPSKDYIDGVRLTHQPSPWIGDYGTFVFMVGDKKNDKPTPAHFTDEVLMPHYIKYAFENGTEIEFTPSVRGGAFKARGGGYLSLYGVHGDTTFEIKDGYLLVTNNYTEKSDAVSFLQRAVITLDGADISGAEIEGGACHIYFENEVSGKLAISYISEEQSLIELGRVGDFEKTLESAENEWEKTLSKIEIESENQTQVIIFYSCMYRAFLFPHKAYEIDKNGAPVHYSPFKGEVRAGVRYTDYGFWDTYRTSIPLFCIIARDELEEMLRGFLNDYYEGGFLPRWSSLCEIGCMPSTLIDGAICESVQKGVGDKELHKELLEAMIHHANVSSGNSLYGRTYLNEYLKYGYVPYTAGHESVNLSLDFAYGDWCIGKVAEILGKEEISKEYYTRARGWEVLFDKETGFVVARDENGNKRPDFDPFVWGYDYTESGAYQNIFGAPHALDTVAALLGGNDKSIFKVDEIINTPPVFKHGPYGCEIHEMTEMKKAPSGLGQLAISNQPSFSIPFLYAYFGNKEKSDYIIKKITTECFTPSAYPGDEDNGSMSAWYIFATIGKFPICPGSGKMVETTPLAKFKIKSS